MIKKKEELTYRSSSQKAHHFLSMGRRQRNFAFTLIEATNLKSSIDEWGYSESFAVVVVVVVVIHSEVVKQTAILAAVAVVTQVHLIVEGSA